MTPAQCSRLFSLDGKIAVVTGASRGIGHALADGLAAAGATVYGIARSKTPIVPFENPVRYHSVDVRDAAEGFFRAVAQEAGSIDILVNAAGITLSLGGSDSELLARFKETLEVDLEAPYRCIVAARHFMTRGASVINVTSIGSVTGFPGNPAYVSAKGGLRMLTKALAVDFGGDGIRVNSLAPGYIRTDMTAGSYANPEQNRRREAHTCLGRWGEVGDLVGAAIFLASDASAYMTGQDLFIDGGWTAKGLV